MSDERQLVDVDELMNGFDETDDFGEFSGLSDEELDAQMEAIRSELESDGINVSDLEDYSLDDEDEQKEPVEEEKGIFDYMPEPKEGAAEPKMKDAPDFTDIAGEIVVQDMESDDDNAFEFRYIDISCITISKRIRKSGSVQALEQSIKTTGLLYPIVVAPLMTEGTYVLIAGLRRLRACAKTGMRKVPCLINNKITTPEIPVVEALYNHNKSYTMDEIISYINYMEKDKGVNNPNLIEYILQMNPGEYTKLKDILNDDDPDITEKLMNNQMTIAEAFKKLEGRRKKETAEDKEQQKSDKVYGTGGEGTEMLEDAGELKMGEPLSNDQVKRLEESVADYTNVDDISAEEIGNMVDEANRIPGFEPNKQDWKNRERLAPELRKAILARDKNTCQICRQISGQEYVETLDVHHIQEVYLGGSDAEENLITACVVCHKLIHLFARGSLYIRPYTEMSQDEQNKFKRIVKLGTKIRLDMQAKNMSREQLKKLDNADTIGRTKPGTGQVAG